MNDVSSFLPLGWHTITPRITVSDAVGLVEFINRVFGSNASYVDEVPTIVKIGDSNLMVSKVGIRDEATAFLYVYVRDVDETYRRAIEAGAATLEEPSDLPYGDRRAMVRDTWGNLWQIATHQG